MVRLSARKAEVHRRKSYIERGALPGEKEKEIESNGGKKYGLFLSRPAKYLLTPFLCFP